MERRYGRAKWRSKMLEVVLSRVNLKSQASTSLAASRIGKLDRRLDRKDPRCPIPPLGFQLDAHPPNAIVRAPCVSWASVRRHMLTCFATEES